MAKSKALGKNPLFQTEKDEPVFTEEQVAQIRAATSDVDLFTTMSFKIRKTHLKKLRDYAYTNRIEIKEALDQALEAFLGQINDDELIEYRVKTRKKRTSSEEGKTW